MHTKAPHGRAHSAQHRITALPPPPRSAPESGAPKPFMKMLTSCGGAGSAEATPPRLFKAARRCRRGSEGGGGAARGGRVLGGTAQLPPSGSLVCLGALPPPRGRGQPPPGLHVCALSPALVSGRCLLPVSGGAEMPCRSVSCPGDWDGGRGGEGAAGCCCCCRSRLADRSDAAQTSLRPSGALRWSECCPLFPAPIT